MRTSPRSSKPSISESSCIIVRWTSASPEVFESVRFEAEAVHLGEQLHHRPLDLGVARGLRVRPLRGDGVDLVDEEDGGLVLAGDLEEVPDQLGALADELVDELGAGHLDERRVRLVGDGLREHRLPGARRAVQQDAARGRDAHVLEHVGVFQRHLDGLPDLLHLVFEPADVGVGDVRGVFDLHHAGADVGLLLQLLDHGQGVVDRDAVVGVELLAHLVGDLRERLLVVPVLFDHGAVGRDLLYRRHEQRGLLQLLVLVGEPLELLLVLVVLRVGVEELVAHLLVLGLEDVEPLLKGVDFLLFRRRSLVVGHIDVVDRIAHCVY
ncbi:hypothetical protein C465_12903 [Halorubrum distributum JCM 9100]|uniref:NAD-specific glutamate dehydrogenase n=1 Tax=Halorubrum distributum JCM 9100 TaxID=1227467 RepID=M0EEU2_9EURY|nr:hypothetical protein C465_12903 [Halorubrum distributum JCM 9100]